MREMRDRGERFEIKYSYFFYNTATVQFYLQNCTVTSIVKNLQYLPLPFFDVDDFKVINAKFSLDMALAFFNANALTKCDVEGDVPLCLKQLTWDLVLSGE